MARSGTKSMPNQFAQASTCTRVVGRTWSFSPQAGAPGGMASLQCIGVVTLTVIAV